MDSLMININKEIKETPLMESYKILRTNLLYVDDLAVIAVTSSMPNEGKTITAFNLARSFAEAGKKVVIVDCDLRKSSLKNYLTISGRIPGLSEVLTKQTTNIICQTDIENLYLIMSGKKPPNPSEILSSERFKQLIESLKKTFDYVIIDTPPVSVAGDASIVGRFADGVLMVVRNEESKKKMMKRSVMNLERNGARMVGVVFNGMKKSSLDYGYGYGYGKY